MIGLRHCEERSDEASGWADYRHRCAIVPPNDAIPHIWMENWNTNEPAFILTLVAGPEKAE
ncbi:hypothetical protein Ms3S1_18830 [Methylosinus sp. 3S-1]|uniref:Uncharacterized protein n=1 Tax=Methylosinus trichosporium (strain ATCC 35070 / NCIMB 11131 / UNIQEM 75 / OB3b) TaxID=595536 RepID=A0A2D2CZF4_METT3|nr:hypothetical protein CQW49_09475 [Methylosinus trichosporium OB3b]OBS54346.1 hypothetical protein A8B73_01005 [Methylosinus sp. 3S-1]